MTEAVQTGPVPAGLKGAVETTELARFERTVARRSAEIRATVPDVSYVAVISIARAEARAQTLGVSLSALVLEACAAALREVPRANGAYRDGRYEQYERVNIATVISDAHVHVAPTVFGVDELALDTLDATLRDYEQRAHSGELSPGELTGSTFTVSLGAGPAVTRFETLVSGGQAAALAVGAVRDEPVIRDGAIVPGRTLALTLSCDQRILHGHHAAAFLAHVQSRLES